MSQGESQREGCTLCDRAALILSPTNAFHEEGPQIKGDIFNESAAQGYTSPSLSQLSAGGSKLSLEILPILARLRLRLAFVLWQMKASYKRARLAKSLFVNKPLTILAKIGES